MERDRDFGAAAVDEDGDFGDRALGDSVISDLSIAGHADQDAAVRRDTIELTRGEGVAADERLADRISGDLHAVGVGDDDGVDVGVVDPVAFDRDVPVLKVLLKSFCVRRRRHADINRSQRVAGREQVVRPHIAVIQAIVPDREVFRKPRLGPETDIAAGVDRDRAGVGELVVLDQGIGGFDHHPAARMEVAVSHRGAGADPVQRRQRISGLERQIGLEFDLVDQVGDGGRALALSQLRDLARELGGLPFCELHEFCASERAKARLLAALDLVSRHQADAISG